MFEKISVNIDEEEEEEEKAIFKQLNLPANARPEPESSYVGNRAKN